MLTPSDIFISCVSLYGSLKAFSEYFLSITSCTPVSPGLKSANTKKQCCSCFFSFTGGSTLQYSHSITSVVAMSKPVARKTRIREKTDVLAQMLVYPQAQGRCKQCCLHRHIQQSSQPNWWTLHGYWQAEGKCDPSPGLIPRRGRQSPGEYTTTTESWVSFQMHNSETCYHRPFSDQFFRLKLFYHRVEPGMYILHISQK